MKTAKISNFFQDKPVFGLDIGSGSLKVMQLEPPDSKVDPRKYRPRVLGYGYTTFDKAAQADGVIIQPETIAKAAHDLFKEHMVGEVNTRRVAMAIPPYRTFTRSLQLPRLKASEFKEAVELEAEQYISLPLEELYLDYEIIKQTPDATELFVVAVPRKIVDSYMELAQILGLEPVLIEPTLSSANRMFSIDPQSDNASLIIDFGTLSSDISIVDKHVLVTGTVEGGGLNFTQSIKDKLGVTDEEAQLIKTRYGLGPSKKQADIKTALEPILQKTVKEIHRMMRYYEERYGAERPINQIITLGGGANMPGLSEYLIETLRLAVRHSDPWEYLDYKGLPPPPIADKAMYATVTGLGLVQPKGVFLA